MRFLLLVATTVAVTVVTAAAVWLISESPDELDDAGPYSTASGPEGDPVLISVEPGDSTQTIGGRLEELGVIDSGAQFRVLVSFLGYDGILQAGEYEFLPTTPALDAIYRMRRGIVSTRAVTVIEGWRLEEIADAFAKEGIDREEFLTIARSTDYYDFNVDEPSRGSLTLEGYLFPATYSVRREQTAKVAIKAMVEAFTAGVDLESLVNSSNTALGEHEVVTLASIIEREAQVASERPIMAQVFLSRLEQGIPLEADPTVQYAVSEDPRSIAAYGYWKQDLTVADLRSDSPYNTYQNAGLPPGPICNPGLASIQAVLNPARTNFLYFVAKADGSHLFAETFDEHLQNISEVEGQ